MKGLFGKQGFQIELRQLPDRPVTGHMVKIRVIACGVCGTDLHFLRQIDDWTPLGHEISAEVTEVGPDVTRVKKGDLVICEDVTMCGACDACKAGMGRLCRNGYTLDDQPGMADEMVVHENMLNPFTGIDPITASMTEPLAVAMRGVDKLQLQSFESIAVFGMGAIGLFSAAYARAIGAGRVVMFARDPNSQRNRAAEAAAIDLGVDEVYYTANENALDEAVSKGAFQAAVVAAPPACCADAMKLLCDGGRAVAMGVTFGKDTHVNLDINDMVFHEKQLLTSIAEPAINFPRSLQMIRSGRIKANRVITHTVPLTQPAAIAALYAADSPAIKTVVLG